MSRSRTWNESASPGAKAGAVSQGATGRGEATPELAARGFPLVLAGPSGSGKTTVGRALVRRDAPVRFSVSVTTREPREEEVDGEDYRFVSREAFRELREEDELLEWAEVHGELYGTPRSELRRAREDRMHLLLDIDVQGARSVRRLAPEAVLVFLIPPDGRRIVRRLRDRGSEDEAELRERMEVARSELAAVAEFDYVVVNEDLRETVAVVESVLRAEEHRIERLGGGVEERANEISAEIRAALGGDCG